MRKRLAVLVLVWLAAIGAGLWSFRQTSYRRTVDRACDAVERGDWAAALDGSEALVGTDFPGLRAAECRAKALFATGESMAGVELLDRLLAEPEAHGWLPEPFLLGAVVLHRRLEGRLPEAAELARRGTARYPTSDELTLTELQVRSELEDEGRVLEEIARRLVDRGRNFSPLGYNLARRAVDRGEPEVAEALLGNHAPQGPRDLVDGWYRVRTYHLANLGESAKLAENSQSWERAGGDPAEVLAWEAVNRSTSRIYDPLYPQLDMLEAAHARKDEIENRELVLSLYYRLIGSLLFLNRTDEALAVFDEASREFDFPPGKREEILRSATLEEEGTGEARTRRARLRFVLPRPPPGASLLVSPDPAEPVDRDFEAYSMTAGTVEVERTIAAAPQRWVLKDGERRTLASGTVWPTESATQEVRIEPRPTRGAGEAGGPALPPQLPADGRRRVLLVLLDGADWRLVQYLRARSDLPVIDALIRGGRRAVLESQPPFTAAALNALVFPRNSPTLSTLGTVNRLGAELAGNSFVEKNPFAFLGWLVPETPTILETVGAGDHVAVNFLHAVGNMEAGEHGEQVGPRGEVGRFTRWALRRSLEPGEAEITSADLERPGYGGVLWTWFEEVAAVFDAAHVIADTAEIDLALIRVASLDLASHRSHGDVSRSTQDDGAYPLYALYRYMDRRLGSLWGRLDQDDVLVVMSDHGVKNSAEHDPRCLFVAAGGEVSAGRVPDMPHLRGVARMLADLLDVETDWPETGIEAWVRELP